MHVILDCDDVLLDWLGGFTAWLRDIGFKVPEHGPASWSLAEWLNVSDSSAVHLFERFNASDEFGQLQPCPWSVTSLDQIKSAGGTMTVLTSCSSDPTIVKRRRDNLLRYFPIDGLVCLDLGESKAT